ncbi:hypothetical protein AVEN_193082-1 [Araneus ventricosus]|uniref:Uncharacterized protein n=1 Tax=Araneus ventricosus TaxID=182803 RepID=A0A4Y2AZT5_ARAVE|nr:hypothetical protein AVEN_193082-1 [Araneus ventricosus]
MESSSTFKRISSANRDIEKIPAPLRSHISSPSLSPRTLYDEWNVALHSTEDISRTTLSQRYLFSFIHRILLLDRQTQRNVSKHQEEQKLRWNIGWQIPKEVDWTRRTHCLASTFVESNPCDFFQWGHLKLLACATPMDTPEDLIIARIVVAVADIKSIPGTFERGPELFLRRCGPCNHISCTLFIFFHFSVHSIKWTLFVLSDVSRSSVFSRTINDLYFNARTE